MTEKLSEDSRKKRQLILDAARELFTQKGYEETTIADIARAANIAVGTIYLYFRNKHDIYTGVALDIEALIAQALKDSVNAELDFEQVPRAMLEKVFRVSRQHKDLMALLQVDMHTQDEVKQHRNATETVTQILSAVLQQAIERGQLAPFNTEMYALLLNLLGSAVMHQCFAVEKGEREEEYREALIELFERLFFGPSLKVGKKSIQENV